MPESVPASPFAIKEDATNRSAVHSPRSTAEIAAQLEMISSVMPVFVSALLQPGGSEAALRTRIRRSLSDCTDLSDEILTACTRDETAIEQADLRRLGMETAAGVMFAAQRRGIDSIQARGMIGPMVEAIAELEGGYAIHAEPSSYISADFLWKVRLVQAFSEVLAKAMTFPIERCRPDVTREILVAGQDIAISAGFALIRDADPRDLGAAGKASTRDEALAAEEAALALLPVVGDLVLHNYTRASSEFRLVDDSELDGFLSTIFRRVSHNIGTIISIVRVHG